MSHSVPTEKTNIPSSSALWAVLIFVGLLIAAINFVHVESTSSEEHGEHGAAVEQHDAAATTPAAHEATATEAHENAAPAAATTPADSTHEHAATPAATEEAHH